MNQAHILIVGCGDLGCTLGKLLLDSGYKVTGLRRSDAPLPAGMHAFRGDVTDPDSLQKLEKLHPDILVYSVAADAQSDESYRAAYVDGLNNVLGALQFTPLRRVLFVSSTRVYGQTSDAWLDETTPPIPEDFGGERLLQGEALLNGRPGTVLRLSGIYGPGRTRLLRLAQEPRQWTVQNSWSNRIHRDDAAAFAVFLIRRALDGATVDDCYVVTDGHPTPQHEVLAWLAERLGARPPKAGLPLPQGGKRLSNTRMLATGFVLRYPDYRAGYEAMIRDT